MKCAPNCFATTQLRTRASPKLRKVAHRRCSTSCAPTHLCLNSARARQRVAVAHWDMGAAEAVRARAGLRLRGQQAPASSKARLFLFATAQRRRQQLTAGWLSSSVSTAPFHYRKLARAVRDARGPRASPSRWADVTRMHAPTRENTGWPASQLVTSHVRVTSGSLQRHGVRHAGPSHACCQGKEGSPVSSSCPPTLWPVRAAQDVHNILL
jgi:hypothetical protein